MNRQAFVRGALIGAVALAMGCRSTYPVTRRNSGSRDSIVFVRPPEYSVFGTKSLRDYIEIENEGVSRNSANLLKVKVGIRNRGGQHLWDAKGRDISLSIKTVFYDVPVEGKGALPPPVYETNWRVLAISRGDVVQYDAICPVERASGYQVVISEVID